MDTLFQLAVRVEDEISGSEQTGECMESSRSVLRRLLNVISPSREELMGRNQVVREILRKAERNQC